MRFRQALALLAAVALVAAAVGCGGGDDGSGTTAAQEATTGEQQQAGSPGSDSGDRGDSQQGSPSQGGGESQLDGVVENPTDEQLGITPGGDNSLQRFGATAEGEERDQVVRRMRGFFAALAKGANSACPYFTDTYIESLEQLAANIPGQGEPANGCEALTRVLSRSGSPGALAAEARRGVTATVLRVGIEDDQAIVMLREKGGQLAYFTMTREGDEWKTSTLSIVRLPGAQS